MLPPVKRGELMSKRLLVVPAFLLALLVVFAVASAQAAPGDLDTSFGTGGKVVTDFGAGNDYAAAVAIQPNGKIVAGGDAQIGSTLGFALARYNADGSLDTSFGSGGRVTTAISDRYDLAYAMALQPDGKIVFVGETRGGTATKYDAAVLRYTPAGALDTTFGSGGKVTTAYATDNDGFEAVAVQLNGKIVAGGWTRQGTPPLYEVSLARYNPNGSLDATFGTGGKVVTVWGGHDDYITGIALQADGKIVGVGAADKSTTFSDYEFALARYEGDTCTVPKLKGKKLAAAKTAIKRATCKVGKVKKRFSKKVKKGRVISQKPAAGTKVAAATPVNLTVSKGQG